MTAMQLRQAVAAQAIAWIGLKESNGSYRTIIDIYNQIKPLPNGYKMSYNDPWCAAFVSAVAWVVGLTKIIFPNASCPRMIELYQKAGRWQEDENYLPNIGDIVFYDWEDGGTGDNRGTADHVGIVVSVSGITFNVVEGNYSDAVKQRTIKRNAKNLRGFGLPDYESMASAEIPVSPEPQAPVTTQQTAKPTTGGTTVALNCSVKLPTLKSGMKNGYVRSFQQMMLARGYSVGGPVKNGREEPDGEFGPTMRKNVIAWQKKAGIGADGIVGAQSWGSILAGK